MIKLLICNEENNRALVVQAQQSFASNKGWDKSVQIPVEGQIYADLPHGIEHSQEILEFRCLSSESAYQAVLAIAEASEGDLVDLREFIVEPDDEDTEDKIEE